jgi:hypothetical protein
MNILHDLKLHRETYFGRRPLQNEVYTYYSFFAKNVFIDIVGIIPF